VSCGVIYLVFVGLCEFYLGEFLTERITQAQGQALHQRTQPLRTPWPKACMSAIVRSPCCLVCPLSKVVP